MENPELQNSEAKQALYDLRAVNLEYREHQGKIRKYQPENKSI